MYKQVQEDLDTKISDFKAMLDIDNRIKEAISVEMAQQNQIIDMKNEQMAKKQSDIMQSLESKVKIQF